MILENSVKRIIEESGNEDTLFLRNLIKEELQNYVLNFIYNNKQYQKLIFTGGTCLKKVYGLNRLSEDLDFDYMPSMDFDIKSFGEDIISYFFTTLQYSKATYKISGKRNMLFLKFPLLKDFVTMTDKIPEDIFLRCDFSEETLGSFGESLNPVTTGSFAFFVRSYDLPTLFSNKIVAFLNRSFYSGKFQKLPFKGRDVYDLFWFLQLSAKSSFNLRPNKERLQKLLGDRSMDEIRKEIKEKISQIDANFVVKDLRPLVRDAGFLEGFESGFKSFIEGNIDFVL